MRALIWIGFGILMANFNLAFAGEFDGDQFANEYFDAWAATQRPGATSQDLEQYLSLLTDDVGHQHLPYDPDGSRSPDGKSRMREGMTYYLGAHEEYEGRLVSHTNGHNVVIIKYQSVSRGIHPQTGEEVVQDDVTVEVLEIDNGKVSVIRKYSD